MTESNVGALTSLRAPVVYVTGKGGVGKTTVAAALAVESASRGKRAALVEFEDGKAGSRALGPRQVGVDHVVLEYDSSLIETLGSILGAKILAKALVSHGALKRLIQAIPALREFSFLDRVCALASSGKYARIVVDLPATGHALDWLRVPKAFDRFLGISPLGNLGRRIHNEIVRPGRADLVVVCLAEPLVVSETQELVARLQDKLNITPSLIVVNRVTGADPQGAWDGALTLLENSATLSDDARELMQVLEARADQARDAQHALELAGRLDTLKLISLPDSARDPLASEVAVWLSQEASCQHV